MGRLILVSQQNNNKKTGIISSIIICLFLIFIAILLINNKQYIIDQITVWQYSPTSEINALVDRAGMNNSGKFIYLASQPKLDATADFNKECDRVEHTTSILGCYSGSRIYIYDVTDKQLDGIREVTATHETLHAIYARMGDSEKRKVNKLVEAEYIKLKSDKGFADLIAFYIRTEPGQRDNELHSIIGTEVVNINPELEIYYRKYFSNRQKAVGLNAKYISVFKALKGRADELSKQYNALQSSISTRIAQYNTDTQALNIDIESFKSRANNNEFSSQAQINNEVANINARVDNLNSRLKSINNDIERQKSIFAEYNLIASQSKKLYSIIDSTLAPVPSI